MAGKDQVRIWVDGCFDMFHYGHANALRQARAMGGYLVVGVHSDMEVTKHKGLPVMSEKERYAAVRSCKWVDKVVEDAPYVTSLALMDKYQCDFCVHGDDLAVDAEGRDVYYEAKMAGRFKECKRTPSISTTDLLGRMLVRMGKNENAEARGLVQPFAETIPETSISDFSGSALRIAQFTSTKEPLSTDTIVYADGTFDLLHIGHLDFLQRAKSLGDYLIVGVHADQTVADVKGRLPVMRLSERVLGVLACRFVDEVIIGAPFSVSSEMVRRYRISAVVHGGTAILDTPYSIPQSMGILVKLPPGEYSSLTSRTIIERTLKRREDYEVRNRRKLAANQTLLSAPNGHV